MLVLKFDDQTINTFDEKVDMFKNLFFLAFSSTNLSDIENSFYLIAAKCLMIIIESEVIKTISRIAFDKISSLDEITNRMIKTCSEMLTRLLTSLFQICVTHAYHSNVFKTINIITLRKTSKIDYTISKVYKLIALLNTIDKIMKFIMSKKIS